MSTIQVFLHIYHRFWSKLPKQLLKKSPLSKEKLSVLLSISRQGTITAPSLKISKVMDNISLNDCHLVHDSFNDKLPHSFNDFSLKATDLNSIGTRHPTWVY